MIIGGVVANVDDYQRKFSEVAVLVNELIQIVHSLDGLGEADAVPRGMADIVRNFWERVRNFHQIGSANSLDALDSAFKHADGIAIFAQAMASSFKKFGKLNLNNEVAVTALSNGAQALKRNLEEQMVVVGSLPSEGVELKPAASVELASEATRNLAQENLEKINNQLVGRVEAAESQLERNVAKMDAFNAELNKLMQRVDQVLSEVSKKAGEAAEAGEARVKERAEELQASYERTVDRLKDYETQASALVGSVASFAMAGGYAKSAATEKRGADTFRALALMLMGVVAIVLVVTLFQAGIERLAWSDIGLRVIISVLLSVPIGYLARESARHRAQQYKHAQTHLDLNAINPYIESLSLEVRQNLKAEMAQRIFFQKDGALNNENGGLDAQEIILKFIEKLDVLKGRVK